MVVSSEANEKLILALPKGRILNEAAPLFARAGIEPEAAFADPDARQLRFTTNHADLDIIRVRSFDVATKCRPTPIVRVAGDGPIGAPRVVLRLWDAWARCPRWSSDSSRLAYLDKSGKVVVRGLDGSRRQWANGDPRARDFVRTKLVPSPTGN